VYKKILTNGSFDRLAHGEEEPKGFFMVAYDTVTGTVRQEFIVNSHATRFDSFDLDKCCDKEDALPHYIHWLNDIRSSNLSSSPILHIRVISNDALLKASIIEYTRTHYADIHITPGRSLNSKASDQSEEVITEITSLPIITEDNLADMIVQFLKEEKDVHLSASVVNEVLHAPN
jgi:hypothetical protein